MKFAVKSIRKIISEARCKYYLRDAYRPGSALSELTIGVTTYVDRYESWCKPLLASLLGQTRHNKVVLAINGFPDLERQNKYLETVRRDWRHENRLEIIEHQEPVGIARLWNEIVRATPKERVLILNDDIEISPCFWLQLAQSDMPNDNEIIKINGIWSHFLVHRGLFAMIGYFDETFTEIGFEDFDFEGRMWLNGIKPLVMNTPYVRHEWIMPKETSYGSGQKVWGKYSSANQKRFLEKWNVIEPGENRGLYLPQIEKCIEPNQGQMEYWPDRDTAK